MSTDFLSEIFTTPLARRHGAVKFTGGSWFYYRNLWHAVTIVVCYQSQRWEHPPPSALHMQQLIDPTPLPT